MHLNVFLQSIWFVMTFRRCCLYIRHHSVYTTPHDYAHGACFGRYLWLSTGLYYPYPLGILHWPWGNRTITAIPVTWWRHQMETFSALLAICAGNSRVPGEFPTKRLVTRSFDVFFDLRLNKRLRKQSWGWWFETLSRPLWRHCNGSSPKEYG